MMAGGSMAGIEVARASVVRAWVLLSRIWLLGGEDRTSRAERMQDITRWKGVRYTFSFCFFVAT